MINVTMLAHSRYALLKQSLNSLGDDDNEKILVLFDNPLDREIERFLDVWSEGQHHPNHQVFRIAESKGTGWARNAVIDMSARCFGRGEYLYLSDDDAFFYPACLEKLTAVYEAVWGAGFKVLGAVNHPYHLPIATIPIVIGGQKVCEVREVQALALQSMLMKWEVWDKYGPFDETPPGRVRMSEDVAFTNKIKADGGKIGVIHPPLVVNTGITDSFGEKIPGWEMVLAECPKGVLCE